MHPYVLISLFSSLAAGMLAGAIWARDAHNRGNQLAALLLVAGSIWSLCDVLSSTAADAATAILFIRLSCVGSILVPPLGFHMLITLEPALRRRYARFLRIAYGASIAFAVVAVTTDAMWVDAHPVSWGWTGEIGIGVAISWSVLVPFPVAALIGWFRLRDRAHPLDALLGIAVGIPALIATMTDFVLPVMEVPFPRVGSASLVTWGAVALWKVYRFRDPILAPHLFAREILATLPDGILLLRLDGTIRAANEKMAALSGRSAAELTGLSVSSLLVEEAERSDGVYEGRAHRLVRVSGEPISVYVRETPLADDDGNPLGYVIVVRDLREVVSLRSRLITSGRLAAVGQLAAGIAHEINNPIAYVQSDLNMLREHWQSLASDLGKEVDDANVTRILEEGAELIEESYEGLDRVSGIVRDVGGFSPNARIQWEEADVNRLLDASVRVTHPQLRDHAAVERHFEAGLRVRCVPQELMQVFLNLLLNAAQAMESAGTIRLYTKRDGDFVAISVVDDGRGMSAQTAEQVFRPFFTTKAVGEGTGLGLSISRQIIEKHGGSIELETASGSGTAFRIRLPINGPEPTPSAGRSDR